MATSRDWVRQAGTSEHLPCIEAYFQGHGYAPHRHDTYAVGCTLAGVQSFRYRGEHRHSLPGQTLVLHPDELHDGHAGTGEGFRYRMVYVPPALLQSMLGGRPLPFVAGGITADPRLAAPVRSLLQRLDAPPDPLEEDDALFDLAEAFIVVKGDLRIDLPDRAVHLGAGEMFVVPRGTRHRPCAQGEVWLMLVEPRGVLNTGDSGGERTAANDIWV